MKGPGRELNQYHSGLRQVPLNACQRLLSEDSTLRISSKRFHRPFAATWPGDALRPLKIFSYFAFNMAVDNVERVQPSTKLINIQPFSSPFFSSFRPV